MILLQLDPLTRPVAISEMLLLLAGAAFIGWLLGRWTLASRVNGLREAVAERQSELEECQATQTVVVPAVAAPLKTPVAAAVVTPGALPEEETPAVPAFRAAAVAPPSIESVADDLKLVEGIGPRIEELLKADGIRTFARLAATSPPHIASLLSAAGPRFQIHDPATWPQQAALARDGKWDELKALQDRLVGGR